MNNNIKLSELKKITKEKSYTSLNNERIKISAETSTDQCDALVEVILEHKYSKTLEIGFAHGVSACAIMLATNAPHTCIEINEQWSHEGMKLVGLLELQNQIKLNIGDSHEVLKRLDIKGNRYDFCYIDSTKVFDHLLMDFFLVDAMLEVGGSICFDDVTFPQIRKLCRYLAQLPHYEAKVLIPRETEETVPQLLKWLRNFSLSQRLFSEKILITDSELNVNGNCIQLLKLGEDQRNWDYSVIF